MYNSICKFKRNQHITRCTHKFLQFFLRDDLTKQYVAYEFETSVCSPDIFREMGDQNFKMKSTKKVNGQQYWGRLWPTWAVMSMTMIVLWDSDHYVKMYRF